MFDERICVGLPCLAGYDLDKALAKVKSMGFKSIMALPGMGDAPHRHSQGEFPTLGFRPDSYDSCTELHSKLKSFSNVSIHQDWNDDWHSWFDCAKLLGAKVVTVHAPILPEDCNTKEFLKLHINLFREMGDYAQTKNLWLGLENIGGTVDIYKQLLDGINHPAAGATLDFGHCAYFKEIADTADIDRRCYALNTMVNETIYDLKDKLIHIHMHNVRKTDWRDHRAIPDGVLDYQAIFKTLNKINYQGLFDLELEEPEQEKQLIQTGKFLQHLIEQELSG